MHLKLSFITASLLWTYTFAQPSNTILNLPIGNQTKVTIVTKTLNPVNLPGNQDITFKKLVNELQDVNFLLIGESHDQLPHHKLQAEIIKMLCENKRKVIVGMEMLDESYQATANKWSNGTLSENQWVDQLKWYQNWGFNYMLYKPIFDVIRKHHLKLIALNAQHSIVSKVGREGYSNLTESDKRLIPQLHLNNPIGRTIFSEMMGGSHPGMKLDTMFEAQTLWNETMAQNAAAAFNSERQNSNLIIVILAGNGHVYYHSGIEFALKSYTSARSASIILEDITLEQADKSQTINPLVGNYIIFTNHVEDQTPEKGAKVEIDPISHALTIRKVTPGGVLSSLEGGDVLIMIDNHKISDLNQLYSLIASKKYGDNVEFLIIRKDVTIRLRPKIARSK